MPKSPIFLPQPDAAANRTRVVGETARLALGASPQRWRDWTRDGGMLPVDALRTVGLADLIALAVRYAVRHEAARHATPGRPPDELRAQALAADIKAKDARAEHDKTRTDQARLALLETRGLVLHAAGVESGVAFVMHVVAGLLRRLPRELARLVPGSAAVRAAFIKAASSRTTSLLNEVAERLAKVANPEATKPLPLPPATTGNTRRGKKKTAKKKRAAKKKTAKKNAGRRRAA